MSVEVIGPDVTRTVGEAVIVFVVLFVSGFSYFSSINSMMSNRIAKRWRGNCIPLHLHCESKGYTWACATAPVTRLRERQDRNGAEPSIEAIKIGAGPDI